MRGTLPRRGVLRLSAPARRRAQPDRSKSVPPMVMWPRADTYAEAAGPDREAEAWSAIVTIPAVIAVKAGAHDNARAVVEAAAGKIGAAPPAAAAGMADRAPAVGARIDAHDFAGK